MTAKRPNTKRSVLPDWLAGWSDDDGTEATGIPSKFLRLVLCDSAGLRRCRVIPISRIQQVVKQGVGMTKACMGLQVWMDAFAPESGVDATGEIRLMPDMDSRVVCAWHPTHEMVVVDMHEAPGLPWVCCPRSALKKVLAKAELEHGLVFKIGQEVEFYLLRPGLIEEATRKGLPEPVDNSLYCQTGAFDNVASVMDDIVDCLESFGIPVEQVHAESGPGQFELAPAPALGVQAADNIILVREAIASISGRHALMSTFVPKPFPNDMCSGAHTHISMQKREGGGENLMGGLLEGLKAEGSIAESFVAGVLEHLKALCVFTAPSPLSYSRIAPGVWSGAFKAWGVHNKETPLRFCPGVESSQSNIEVKNVDNTANPYICLSAIITAGLQGVRANLRLPTECTGDPADDPSLERLPKSLEEAIACFEEDTSFKTAFEESVGTQLVQAYMAVRKVEAKTAGSMSMEEQVLKLYQRY